MTTVVKNKVKKVSVKELQNFLNKILASHGIQGSYKIPSSPDVEGDYYIVIRAKNISSNKKAIELSHSIEDVIQKQFGENIYISIIPT